jgi:tRNA pseudouridine55 synthase
MKGFINLIKPEGMSSAYAVGSVKRKLNANCGHMGTLDPMASGVLPVGLEKTSRLFQYLLDKNKTYVARFKFGFTTDTLDTTGVVTERTGLVPSAKEIESVLKNFIGEIDQIPPKYSAKCIDGKRGYQLARKGVDFTLEPKKVTVLNVELLSQTDEDEFEFKIDCKGGTYIRSLARDIAYAVNTVGTMSKLTRTASGVFSMENGVTVEEFMSSDNPQKYILPADMAVDFNKIVLSSAQAQKILDGVYEDYGYLDGTYRVYNQSEFWGVGVAQEGKLRIKAYVR